MKKNHENHSFPDRLMASPREWTACAFLALALGLLLICLSAAGVLRFEGDSGIFGFVLGGFFCLAGLFLLWFVSARAAERVREAARNAAVEQTIAENAGTSPALRPADPTVKCRVFLQIKKDGHDICYRRVKTTNELVIDGMVYDEKKALVEFDHRLVAVLDGHTVEAGLSEELSYIRFDGRILKKERRVI